MAVENFEDQDLDNVQNTDDEQETDNVLVPANLHLPEVEVDIGVVEEKKWPGWPGENVFRMLVPAQKVGGIIGRKGEHIKRICEETKSRIKILDAPPGTTERTVLQIMQDINLSCGCKQEALKTWIEAMSNVH